MPVIVRVGIVVRVVFAAAVISAASAARVNAQPAPEPAEPQNTAQQNTVVCESREGQRQHCPADDIDGVALVKSTGSAPCLLGKTWGYDNDGIWASDGCSGEFIAGQAAGEQKKSKAPEYVPNGGFLLYDGEKGQIYFRLMSYVRYLNQRNLDASYTDAFGIPHAVQQRQDIQLAKFFAPFSGWFLTPSSGTTCMSGRRTHRRATRRRSSAAAI